MDNHDPFDAENVLPAILITLSRIYDLLAMKTVDEFGADLVALHEQGGLAGPPPFLDPEAMPEKYRDQED